MDVALAVVVVVFEGVVLVVLGGTYDDKDVDDFVVAVVARVVVV